MSLNFFSQTVPLGSIEDGNFHVVGHPRLGEITENKAFAGNAGHLINTHTTGEHEAAGVRLDFLYLRQKIQAFAFAAQVMIHHNGSKHFAAQVLGGHGVSVHDGGVKAYGLELIFHGLQDGGVAVGHKHFFSVLIAVFFSHDDFPVVLRCLMQIDTPTDLVRESIGRRSRGLIVPIADRRSGFV